MRTSIIVAGYIIAISINKDIPMTSIPTASFLFYLEC